MTSLALKSTLTDRELALLTSEMPNRAKSVVVAFLLWFFLSTLGIYHFYLGNSRRGWVMVILTIVGFLTAIVLIGFVILLGLLVVWIVDGVHMSSRVQRANAEIENHLINEIIAGRSVSAPPAAAPAQ